VTTPAYVSGRKTRLAVIWSGVALAATADYKKAEGIIRENGLLKQLTKA